MSYQSDYSGAQVDEAVGKALNPDAAPTASSTNLVESGGVYGVLSKRNLLDNPFFGSGEVVNQRGVTSGTTTNATYFIDRWLTTYGSAAGTYSLWNNGITLTPASGSTATMYQKLANASAIDGKAVTASVLLSDGTIYSGTITRASGTTQNYYNANGIRIRQVTDNGFHIDVSLNGGVTIRAVKLELGSVSTLANDAPPNFAEELAKCQYYFCKIKANEALVGRRSVGNPKYAAFQIPVRMRATPSASLGTGSATIYGQSGATYTFSSFDNSLIDYNAIGVYLTGNATYAGEVLTMWSTSGISLSADL